MNFAVNYSLTGPDVEVILTFAKVAIKTVNDKTEGSTRTPSFF